MKVIVTADIHIDINNRLEDIKTVLNQMANYAVKNKVYEVWVLGDIYEKRRPYNSEKALFEKFVKFLSEHGIIVRILAGNHDMDKDMISTVEEFKILDLPGIHLHPNPCILNIRGKDIFLGHFLLAGAKLGPSDYIARTPMSVKSLLKRYKADLYLLGDVHKAQKLHKNPDIIYVGSPERINFGERNEVKGFLLLEFYVKKLKYSFINLKNRPMLQYDIDNIKSWLISDINDPREAIVKVSITCDEETYNTINEKDIREKLKNAKEITIDYNVIKTTRIRNNKISESKSPVETFLNYAKTQKFDDTTKNLGLSIIEG